jgi:hypothetical protein
MTEILFSTVFRYAPIDQAGELVKLDWDKKQVVNKTSVAPKTLQFVDPNPRGNSRGGRGIAVVDDKVIVAGYCELQVYDLSLNPLYNITNNFMSGLHEVFHESGQRLWVTSTTLNAALLIDIQTGELLDQVWVQEIPEFQERWYLTPRNLNKNEDNRIRFINKNLERDSSHLHFNAVSVWKGDLFGLFNRYGAVVNLRRNKVILEDRHIFGAHNLIILDDGTIFINDTRNQGVNIYNMDGVLKKRINLLPFHRARNQVRQYKLTTPFRKLGGKIGFSQPEIVMPFFVRGMDIKEDLLFIGISPAAILCLNWQTGKLVDVFNYSDDTKIAVHGLKLV